ncbi:hypothetical protein PIB30_095118, partial [Stylosanthes scabra]|nr:hypothetical protein [Stylosanthes scabra]
MQASQAPPHSSKVMFGPSPRLGSNGNKDKQSLNFDPEIERTLHKLRKQSKQTHEISSEEVFEEVSDNVTAKEVLEEGCANMAEARNQRRTLADFTNPTSASCGSSIVCDSPKTFSFLYKRAIPASGPDQVVSLYEWISFPRRSVDQAIFQLTLQ